MKNNKLVGALLALLVCLSLVISVSAASSNELTFALEPSGSSVEGIGSIVKSGDTFTVSVNIVNNPTFLCANFNVAYDANVVELVSIDKVANGCTAKDNGGEIQFFVGDIKAALSGTGDVVTMTGSIATLTFKVESDEDVATNIALVIKKTGLIDKNGAFGTIAFSGDELTVSVVSKNHVCDAGKTVEANNKVEPTCSKVGKNSDLLCAVCGKLLVEGKEIPTLNHTAGEVKKENEVNAGCVTTGSFDSVTYCSVCNAEMSREKVSTPAVGHNWGAPFISKAATCTEDGQFSVTCGNCKETVATEEKLPATGHSWDNGAITVAPGCTTKGEQTFTCRNCGEKQVDANVPATGHAWSEFVETKAPTVEEEGVKTSTCSNCKETKTESIPKLPEKSNVALIICIVAAVVLVGAGCAAFFVLKNKKK